MNMPCEICELMKDPNKRIYEDEFVVAILLDRCAAAGHMIITTKRHFPIIEQIPDNLVSHLFNVANKLSTITFETLGAQGTNMIINNGIEAGQKYPHTVVHMIPRRENDNIDMNWQPQQLSEEEFSTIEIQIKSFFEQAPAQVISETPKDGTEVIDSDDSEKENYLLKSLRRIP